MNAKISLARAGDAANLAQMSRTLIEYGLPWSWTEGRIRHHILHSECAVIVARDRRRLAGFASMQFLDAHAHLNLLAVRPGYRQRGIGRALINWLEACARIAGIFDVRLELRLSNEPGYRFYERLGYTQTGIRPDYYAGCEDARRMSHNLSVLQTSS